MAEKSISIVVPIYDEEKNIPRLVDRLDSVTGKLPEFNWRYVLVNDGSLDGSWDCIFKLARESSRIYGIDLSRNFGKEIALTAGVHHTRDADAVICIDADLQHPPELIPELIAVWRDGTEVVSAVRSGMEGNTFFRKLGSRLFYWIMSRISKIQMVPGTTDFRLYDRKAINAFCEMSGYTHIFRGVMDWMGFSRAYLAFEADPRLDGASHYSYKKLLELGISSITSFTLWPLLFVGFIGLLITTVAGLLLVWMVLGPFVLTTIFHVQSVSLIYTPLAFVVVINTILIGIVLLSLGLVALYIGAIHSEVVDRPLYLVRTTVGADIARPEK